MKRTDELPLPLPVKPSRTRIIGVSAVTLLVLATFTSTWVALRELDRQTRAGVGGLLGGVVEASRNSMVVWARLEGMRSHRLARDSQVVAAARQLTQTPAASNATQLQARAILAGVVKRTRDPELLSYQMLARDLTVLAATNEGLVGQKSDLAAQYRNHLLSALTDSVVVVPPGRGRDVVSVAAGVDQRSPGGATALFVLQYSPDGTFAQSVQHGSSGITGEGYAIDAEGVLLTRSRFSRQLSDAGLIPRETLARGRLRIADPGVDITAGKLPAADPSTFPLTRMAAEIAAGRSGRNVDGYRDYRGTRVLGAWAWEPTLQVGIVSEMDEVEALAGYRESRKALLAALIGLGVLIGALGYSLVTLATRNTRELRRARDDWEEVATKRLAENSRSERQYRDLFEDSADGMLVVVDGIYVACNRSAMKMLGCDSRDHIVGLPLGTFSPKSQPDGIISKAELLSRIDALNASDEPVFNEWICRRRDGTEFEAEARVRVVTFDGDTAVLTVLRDISPTRIAEREARQHASELQLANDELNRSQAALAAARDTAEAATHAKSNFLANMSHEIRTPMNAIMGYAQILRRDETIAPETRQKIDIIHRSGTHLLTIINDVLEMSKIEAGRAVLSETIFDPTAVLRDAFLMFEQLAGARGLSLQFGDAIGWPTAVRGDAVKIRQVLVNLIGNAVKFTERGEIRIRPRVPVMARGVVRFVIEVEDTGTGIEESMRDRIFEPFDQGGNGSRVGGTGLGLAISRRFARMMHGDLTAVSEIGAGSTFTFAFECSPSEIAPVAPAMRVFPLRLAAAHNNATVLVVDDVETNRELLRELLSRLGFIVRLAVSGEEAIEIAGSWNPQLILMDLRMPGIGGVEAMRRLRANGVTTKMLAITASVLELQESAVRAAGADAFLRKPYDETQLLAIISELISVTYEFPEEIRAQPAIDVKQLDFTVLPLDLVAELLTAARQARHQRLLKLATQVSEHSVAAGAQIHDWAEAFDYGAVAAALGARK